ncbi:hypothetical protein SEEM9199_06346 [Salmonella enterica subsp. enterica serovar Montevideo str. IA_2009159199]|nr:hypothetical protein SEEM9199_06346 [Salmonella enterica subsp. enterica serovar Montevideo str. IA_2009159199]
MAALLVVPEEIKSVMALNYFFSAIFIYAWEGNPYANVFFFC